MAACRSALPLAVTRSLLGPRPVRCLATAGGNLTCGPRGLVDGLVVDTGLALATAWSCVEPRGRRRLHGQPPRSWRVSSSSAIQIALRVHDASNVAKSRSSIGMPANLLSQKNCLRQTVYSNKQFASKVTVAGNHVSFATVSCLIG